MRKRPRLSKQFRRKFVSREEYNKLVKYCEHISDNVNKMHKAFELHNHGNVRVTLGKTTEHNLKDEVKENTVA